MVKINGSEVNAEGVTVMDYISGNNYNLSRVAVEINGNILPKSQYENTVFADGDTVEIVGFVGGG